MLVTMTARIGLALNLGLDFERHAAVTFNRGDRDTEQPRFVITLRCDGCIAVHLAAAVKPGATREEIAEALGVGISVNAGAALVYSARTLDAFDATA